VAGLLFSRSDFMRALLLLLALAIQVLLWPANAQARAGTDGFLSKPVDEARLHEVIETTIGALLVDGYALRGAGAAPALVHAPAPARDDSALARQFGVMAKAGETPDLAPLPGLSAAHRQRIAQAFVLEAPRRLAQARSAIDAGDAVAAADALHALKGGAGYLSSARVHHLAGALEALANAGLLSQVQSGFGQLELALGAVLGKTATAGALLADDLVK
jgi:HPt (histidine-containing phosphotransfer) domain-containing protein